jgi:putative pyruvate formate lyase activating enzyme
MICNNCPRKCNIDRYRLTGFCGVGEMPRVAKAYLHKWEEPIICGNKGSGTVFFSGCNLRCVYCQNYKISHENYGKYITYERLAEIFKELESAGASNINLVSPTHYIHAIKKALDIYRPNIPIVYNSSGYDDLDTLQMLKDYIDIYLVDFKYFDSSLAKKYSNAENYPDVVKRVIKRMREYQPREIIEGGVLKKGVIIRHMVIPSHVVDSKNILKWIKDNISNPFVSLMGQYTPMYRANEFPEINRKLKPLEYKIVQQYMVELGLINGYAQELSSADECYTPKFDCEGV